MKLNGLASGRGSAVRTSMPPALMFCARMMWGPAPAWASTRVTMGTRRLIRFSKTIGNLGYAAAGGGYFVPSQKSGGGSMRAMP
jgi:hypothetical protein